MSVGGVTALGVTALEVTENVLNCRVGVCSPLPCSDVLHDDVEHRNDRNGKQCTRDPRDEAARRNAPRLPGQCGLFEGATT